MKANDKILVIEDDEENLVLIIGALISKLCITKEQILIASDVPSAREAFLKYQPQIVAICLDGCLNSQGIPDTFELSHEFKQAGFSGPIVAMSSSRFTRQEMLENGGCTHEVEVKREVARLLEEFFQGNT